MSIIIKANNLVARYYEVVPTDLLTSVLEAHINNTKIFDERKQWRLNEIDVLCIEVKLLLKECKTDEEFKFTSDAKELFESGIELIKMNYWPVF